MPQNPFLDLNASQSSPQISNSSYRPGRQAAKQRMDRSDSLSQIGRRQTTKRGRANSNYTSNLPPSPSQIPVTYDDDASIQSTSTMSSYKTIPNHGASEGMPKIHAKTHRSRTQSAISTHNSSTDPTGNAGIMHQKEVILSRVDDMTQEYMDPPPVDPLTGDPDQTLKKVDETAELRTNIGFAIEHAMSLQQMNEAEKGSLNSLLDWFFELRQLEQEKADEFNSDEGQLFKEDNSGLIMEAAETVSFLRNNKKTVDGVAVTLKKIIADIHKIHEDTTKAVTNELNTKVRMKDIDISQMKRSLLDAELSVNKLEKNNSNMEKRMRSTDMRVQTMEDSKHRNESGWADLSRTFSEKIIHLEKLLAQESSKAKMMEQILRSGGLELQMELKNKEKNGDQQSDDDEEDKEYMAKLLSKVNDLADQLQSKNLEVNAINRKSAADIAKLQSTVKITEAKSIEKGKMMLQEIDEFKKKFIEEMSAEAARKDADMKEVADKYEAQITRMRDLLKEAEQREKAFEGKLKEKETNTKKAQMELKGALTEIEDLKKELATVKDGESKLNAKIELLEAHRKTAGQGKADLQEQFESEKADIEADWEKRLEAQAGNNKKQMAKQSEELTSLRNQLDEWKKNSEGSEAMSREAQLAAETTAKEIADLKKQLAEMEQRKNLAETQKENSLKEAAMAHAEELEKLSAEKEALEQKMGSGADAHLQQQEELQKQQEEAKNKLQNDMQSLKLELMEEKTKLTNLEKAKNAEIDELKKMLSSAGSVTSEEKEALQKELEGMSKLLGKEKLKAKASQMAAKTQKHELQKQLDASEAQAQRSLGDNSALRRHLATTESNLKMAHKLLIDVSDEQEDFKDFERVDKVVEVLHEMEKGANSKKLERSKRKIEKENKRKANMVMAMLRRASATGFGGAKRDSVTSKIWTDERKQQFVAMAKRKSMMMDEGMTHDETFSKLNQGDSYFHHGKDAEIYAEENPSTPGSSRPSKTPSAQEPPAIPPPTTELQAEQEEPLDPLTLTPVDENKEEKRSISPTLIKDKISKVRVSAYVTNRMERTESMEQGYEDTVNKLQDQVDTEVAALNAATELRGSMDDRRMSAIERENSETLQDDLFNNLFELEEKRRKDDEERAKRAKALAEEQEAYERELAEMEKNRKRLSQMGMVDDAEMEKLLKQQADQEAAMKKHQEDLEKHQRQLKEMEEKLPDAMVKTGHRVSIRAPPVNLLQAKMFERTKAMRAFAKKQEKSQPTEIRRNVKEAINQAKKAARMDAKIESIKDEIGEAHNNHDAVKARELHEKQEGLEGDLDEIVMELDDHEIDDILDAIRVIQTTDFLEEAEDEDEDEDEVEEEAILDVLQNSLNTSDLKDLSNRLAQNKIRSEGKQVSGGSQMADQMLQAALVAGNIAELATMDSEILASLKNVLSQIQTTHGDVGDLKAREKLLKKQSEVLQHAMNDAGGWRSCVFLENGEVDFECDVSVWPDADQVLMLGVINDRLMLLVEEERDQKSKAKREAREALKAAKAGAASKKERTKQETLHKAVRKLWRTASSVMDDEEKGPEEGSRPSTAGTEDSEVQELILHDFPMADGSQIEMVLERDGRDVEKLNDFVGTLTEKAEMLAEMKEKFEGMEMENERLRREAENYVDPSILNELDGLRKELENRERLVADLQNAIGEKTSEVDGMRGQLSEAEARFGASDSDARAELENSKGQLASNLEQLRAMQNANQASENMARMLKERIKELELSEAEFKRQVEILMQKEASFEDEMNALLEARKADEFALAELEKQLSMALDGDGKQRLEALRRRREKKLGKYSNAIADLIRKREENLLEVMKSYKWIHHVPQVVFNGVPYSSLVEWAERKRLEIGEKTGVKIEKVDTRFMDALHLEGKAFEEMKRKQAEMEQYEGGGGLFFVTSDLRKKQPPKRRKSFDGGSGGYTGFGLVQYRQSADIDKQPYGPWGRHPELRYPYADPGQPGSGDIGVYAEVKEETAGGQKFVRKGAGKDDGFQWGSSFEKARQQKMPVKRVQQTWQAKKPLVGKGVVLPDLPKGAKGREEGPTTEERGGGELWGGLDVKAGGGGSGEVVKSNLKPIKGGALSLRG
ncbi:hypothetical protein TL16_g06995 [Triparma laevis f. inornata]|uniref:Uncharacterized protein n=1 Tax=Triparma laevis f. inornata TaxID=1714386 RepID=A0A9W7EET9_9STRA|nr:hypothetical protein TL16_g06995 [Triparma laevis f. inornata]